MQTFLPHPNFAESARSLDYRRLGKQRVETMQLLKAIVGGDPKAGWRNHPAAKMWAVDPAALLIYGLHVCDAWLDLGYRDTCREKIFAFRRCVEMEVDFANSGRVFRLRAVAPVWLGDEKFHQAHRWTLLRKDPAFYETRFDDYDRLAALHYVPSTWPTGRELRAFRTVEYYPPESRPLFIP